MTPAAENALPFSPEVFAALFAIGFPLFWLVILRIIAALGWEGIEAAFPATSDPPASARRVRWGSLSVGGGMMGPNYNSCINAWLGEAGFWLRPSLMFQVFHPMIYIPWAHVQSIECKRVLFFESARVKLGGGVPDLLLRGKLARAVLEHRSGARAGRGRSEPLVR
jgi:hypothetical protein